MGRYIARRLATVGLILFLITLITFGVAYLLPADPAKAVAGDRATQETIDAVRRNLGLDQPLYVQYGRYIWNLLNGDLGISFSSRRPVTEMIGRAWWPSMQLAMAAVALEVLLGIPLAVVSALKKHSLLDRVFMIGALAFLSIPNFWFGLLLLYIFGSVLGLLPLGGYGSVKHLILPALAVAVPYAAWYGRLLRSTLIEVSSQDYVRTAQAKGLKLRIIIFRHMLRNALLPLITMWGLDMANFFSGLVLIEVIFGWPGIGREAVQAAWISDLPVIMGTVLIGAVFVNLASLVLDLLYPVLDPRIKYA